MEMDEDGLLRSGVSYNRESTGKLKSVADQKAENRAEADRLGVRLVDELSDGTSASRFATKKRQNWGAILAMVPTVDVVFLWEPSRGDRDLETWVAFVARCREHGTRIHATGYHETYDPRNPRHWRALIEDGVDASYETEKMSLRIRRGVATAAAAGRPFGVTVYGYRRLHDERTGELTGQDKDPDTAPVAEEIITRIARAEPINAVCKDLNQRGVPAPKGGGWTPATVRIVCRNADYIGRRDHKGQRYAAIWPPVVDEATWHAANRVLDDPARRTHLRPGKVKWMLSGLLTCAACTDGHVGVSTSHRYTFPRYKCQPCGRTTLGVAELDELVSRLVVARLSREDLRPVFVKDDKQAKAAQAELARLEARLTEARRSFALGEDGISAAPLAEIERLLAPKIAEVRRQAVPSGMSLAVVEMLDAAQHGEKVARPVWDALPVASQREIIRLLVDTATLTAPSRRLSRHANQADRLAAATQRLKVTWRDYSGSDRPARTARTPRPRPAADEQAPAVSAAA